MKMGTLFCRSFINVKLQRRITSSAESAVALRIIPLLSSLSRGVSTTSCLSAEPLKKKKRIDPVVIKAREDRRRRKLEKQIRRLEKSASQLKPLVELEVAPQILDNFKERVRKITVAPEEEERRWLLQKDWSRYMLNEVVSRELRMIDRMLASQQKALEELRNESEKLYEAAIQLDYSYIPCEINGLVETPPIKDYSSAEGDFVDISRKWE